MLLCTSLNGSFHHSDGRCSLGDTMLSSGPGCVCRKSWRHGEPTTSRLQHLPGTCPPSLALWRPTYWSSGPFLCLSGAKSTRRDASLTFCARETAMLYGTGVVWQPHTRGRQSTYLPDFRGYAATCTVDENINNTDYSYASSPLSQSPTCVLVVCEGRSPGPRGRRAAAACLPPTGVERKGWNACGPWQPGRNARTTLRWPPGAISFLPFRRATTLAHCRRPGVLEVGGLSLPTSFLTCTPAAATAATQTVGPSWMHLLLACPARRIMRRDC